MKPGEMVVRWTDADISFMRANSTTMSWAEIGATLGRTKNAVQTKALEIGLRKTKEFITKRSMISQFKTGHVPVRRSRLYANAWKPEDIQYLVDNYEHKTCNEIAAHLKRTPGAVKTTANKVLKLKKSAESKKLISKRPNAGQFTKGQLPANTLHDEYITVRASKGKQCKWIRLSCGKWQQLHHYNWLKAGNTIPEGYVVQFIDEDPMNCEPDNLKLVLRGRHSRKGYVRKEKPAKIRKEQPVKVTTEKVPVVRRAKRIGDQFPTAAPAARPAKRLNNRIGKSAIRKAERIAAKEEKQQAAAEARRRAELLRHEERRIAKAAKERRRLEFESEDRRRLPTRTINYAEMVPVKVDSKTTIYIKAGQDPEAAKQRFLSKHR